MLAETLLVTQGVILAVLLAISAFFSLSETAMIAVKRGQVRALVQQGDHRAIILDKMLDQPERLLSTVLVGNNVVNITAATLATVVSVQLFPNNGAIVASIVMTVLVILFGEITPKTLSVQNPLPIALAVARPLRVVESLLKPVITATTWVGKGLARLLGARTQNRTPYITQEEIQMIVEEGLQQGDVQRFEARVITDVFDFTDTDVHHIMTPAAKVHFLRDKATLADAAHLAAKEGRTRIPVVRGDFDHVLGFIHIKDLLKHTDLELGRMRVTEAMRPCLFATADTPADRLLVRMQKQHTLLAIIQEGGNNIGLVTAEDLLEELVGELHDELDRSKGRVAPNTVPPS